LAFGSSAFKLSRRRVFDLRAELKVLFALSKKDIQMRYLGSLVGAGWAVIQPVVTVLIYWFLFQFGFRTPAVSNIPFILWFVPALISWNFMADALLNGTNAITDNVHLVKKMLFRVELLPVIRILSSLYVHMFFILFTAFMTLVYGYGLTVYLLEVFYYTFCAAFVTMGLVYISSSLAVFIKDIGQIVSVMLQFGFWVTPVFWPPNHLSGLIRFLVELNPAYYITQGYRDAFVNHEWFWYHLHLTLYFWFVSSLICFTGITLMHRLKPHFVDVL